MSATAESTAAAPAPEPAPAADRGGRAVPVALGVILVVAAGLRLWGVRQGLPYAYNLDERAHFVPHAVTMTAGNLNPGYFINPPAFTYLIALVLRVLHPGGGIELLFAQHPGQVFEAARLISVVLGVGAVAATYGAGRAWFDRRAGLLGAAVMAVSFLPVFYSRLALNDGPAVLPCALALWAAAAVFRGGGWKAFAAGGACAGLAAGTKYSDGVIAVAVVAAALVSPGFTWRWALKGLVVAGVALLALVLVTDPYMLGDWHTFVHDLNRQRKFADGAPLIGQVERNGWVYYAKSLSWALGVVPALLGIVGVPLLAVRRRWREAVVFAALGGLFWLYMGSQHRFYARWMLPLYPALAVLAGYTVTQAVALVPRRVAPYALAAAAALLLVPTLVPTARNARVVTREDTRTITRDWLVAHVPRGTKVVFEPIAPTEWYGVTPGGGPKADPRRQWQRFNRSQADIAFLAKQYHGAKRTADFENYERTVTPALVTLYERQGYCWVVSGSTEYGRAAAEPHRAPQAAKYYKRLRDASTVAFRVSPVRAGRTLPRYQVDRSFNYVDSAFYRPGPEMIVYHLRNCG